MYERAAWRTSGTLMRNFNTRGRSSQRSEDHARDEREHPRVEQHAARLSGLALGQRRARAWVPTEMALSEPRTSEESARQERRLNVRRLGARQPEKKAMSIR
jgi:hypothetical protein